MSEADSNIPSSSKKHKRGDVRGDGMIYWGSGKLYPNGEYWVTPENFTKLKARRHFLHKLKYKSRATGKPRGKKPDPPEVKEAKKKAKYLKFRSDPARVERQRLARIEWQKRNKDHLNAKHKAKRDNDPVFAAAHRIRRLTNFAFSRKGYKKSGTAEQLLGCSWEQLKAHIESKFLPGMSWENRHEWHVDHIIPLASAQSPQEIEALCKWHNLQPLWGQDNLKKGAKITSPSHSE